MEREASAAFFLGEALRTAGSQPPGERNRFGIVSAGAAAYLLDHTELLRRFSRLWDEMPRQGYGAGRTLPEQIDSFLYFELQMARGSYPGRRAQVGREELVAYVAARHSELVALCRAGRDVVRSAFEQQPEQRRREDIGCTLAALGDF